MRTGERKNRGEGGGVNGDPVCVSNPGVSGEARQGLLNHTLMLIKSEEGIVTLSFYSKSSILCY